MRPITFVWTLALAAGLALAGGCALVPLAELSPYPTRVQVDFREAVLADGAVFRPVYPEFAYRANIEGVVTARFEVEPDGRATGATVLVSPNDALSASVLNAFRHARWVPSTLDGHAVRDTFSVAVEFIILAPLGR